MLFPDRLLKMRIKERIAELKKLNREINSAKLDKDDELVGAKDSLKILWRTLKFIISCTPKLFAGAVILTVLASSLSTANSWALSHFIGSVPAAVLAETFTPELNKYLGFLVGITILFNLLWNLLNEILARFYTRVSFETDKIVQLKVSSIDAELYDSPKTQDLIRRGTSGSVVNRVTHIPDRLQDLLTATVNLVLAVSILARVDINVLIITVLCSLPIAINNIQWIKKIFILHKLRSEDRRFADHALGYVRSEKDTPEIRINNFGSYILSKFQPISYQFGRELDDVSLLGRMGTFALSLIRAFGMGVSYYLIVQKVLHGNITYQSVIFYISLVDKLSDAVRTTLSTATNLLENGIYLSLFFRFCDLPKKIVSGPVVLAESPLPPKIEFKNVSFKYLDATEHVFQNFNLTILPKEHVAIVGENGAGKTTLVKLLLRLYEVTDGEILIDGIDLRELNLEAYYKKIGVLFQDYNFYHFDVTTNIASSRIEGLKEQDLIIQAAKKAGAHGFVDNYDNKYAQLMNKGFKGGISPSQGQKQRIALARTFFKNAPILIMDEPTSAIDPKAEYEIFQELLSFSSDKTLLIISHRFSTVRNADRILVLDAGKVVEEGSHAQLMTIETGLYKTAFNLQKKGYD